MECWLLTGNGFAVNTIDRYLLRRFGQVFGIGLFATLGLYVVFDGITNVDGFQDTAKSSSSVAMLQRMAEHYGYQSVLIFDLVAPILTVIATMVVFALLQKNKEIHPILSAGVPAYRLLWPMLAGTLAVNGLLMLNQEFVLPVIAEELLRPISASESAGQDVQTRRDFASHIEIGGQKLLLKERTLLGPEFLLPAPEATAEITTLKAKQAVYHRRRADRPGGWHLQDPNVRFQDLRLTPEGRELIRPIPDSDDIFVITNLGCEQLLGSAAAYRYQSTADLVERLRIPSQSLMTSRAQAMHLHERLTKPIGSLLAVCLTLPLVMRKESFSLITNLAVCTLMLLLLMILAQASQYLGRVNLVPQDLAVWLPIIVSGGLAAWYSDRVQT